MINFKDHFINQNTSIRKAIEKLDSLSPNAICFVVDSKERLLGSITDGDVRRGIIAGAELDDTIKEIIQPNPKSLKEQDLNPSNFKALQEKRINWLLIVSLN